MEVTLEYRVPVIVTVDVTARRVCRVRVLDEEARYKRISPAPDTPALADCQRLCDEAQQIAEEAEWPPWEFGL